jgi:hypothetical protein
MFNSTILDVAVGLIFTFLAVSLVASTITEALASFFKWRSSTLLDGIKNLLNDPKFEGLARDVYNHALVNPRGNGKAVSKADVAATAPAYVDPTQFATALIDVAQTKKIEDEQLQQLLNGVSSRAAGNVEKAKAELAAWFDSAMDRVSGAYKRKAQAASFIVALLAAVILNVNTIHVAKMLWQQPMVTKAIQSDISISANDAAANAVKQVNMLGLPIGWQADELTKVWSEPRTFFSSPSLTWVEALLGWLITAFAALFGAPFWFDALQKIVRLKGSGPSPAEKKADTGAAA